MKKANFLLSKIVNGREVRIPLRIVESMEPDYRRSVIVKESATGDGGITYDNGRLLISLTINGELLATSNDELMFYEKQIYDFMGSEVLLISDVKFRNKIYSGFWLIENFIPRVNNDSDVSSPFNMVLKELRRTNVRFGEDTGNLNATRTLVELQKSLTGLNNLPITASTDVTGDEPATATVFGLVSRVAFTTLSNGRRVRTDILDIRASVNNLLRPFNLFKMNYVSPSLTNSLEGDF